MCVREKVLLEQPNFNSRAVRGDVTSGGRDEGWCLSGQLHEFGSSDRTGGDWWGLSQCSLGAGSFVSLPKRLGLRSGSPKLDPYTV